jgi:hypothetical protein
MGRGVSTWVVCAACGVVALAGPGRAQYDADVMPAAPPLAADPLEDEDVVHVWPRSRVVGLLTRDWG